MIQLTVSMRPNHPWRVFSGPSRHWPHIGYIGVALIWEGSLSQGQVRAKKLLGMETSGSARCLPALLEEFDTRHGGGVIGKPIEKAVVWSILSDFLGSGAWICQLGAWICQSGAWICLLGVWTCRLGAWTCLLGAWTCFLGARTCLLGLLDVSTRT